MMYRIYEAYYKNTLLQDQSPSSIAWIGSLQTFFLFAAGLISGPLMDRYGPKVYFPQILFRQKCVVLTLTRLF
jgi:MFS family permease